MELKPISPTATAQVSRSERTGLPVVRLGTVITTEDVRALDDDET